MNGTAIQLRVRALLKNLKPLKREERTAFTLPQPVGGLQRAPKSTGARFARLTS
jgi:hypothetical protein